MLIIASVTAGLKWAPDTTASVWNSTNSTKTWTSPITEKSMNGCTPFCGGATYRLKTIVMKKTSPNVPMNSATKAAGPLSGGSAMAFLPCSGVLTRGSLVAPAVTYDPRRMRARMALLAAAAALLLAGCGGGSGAPPRATLALDFAPNGVHAGIYAALARGLDRKHGVRLVIRQPNASTDSLKLLAARRADLAILDIHDLGLASERGADVVGVGELVTRPLAAAIGPAGGMRPRDPLGRRGGRTRVPSDTAVLRSMVQADGGDYARVRTVTIGFSAVPSLITKKGAAA